MAILAHGEMLVVAARVVNISLLLFIGDIYCDLGRNSSLFSIYVQELILDWGWLSISCRLSLLVTTTWGLCTSSCWGRWLDEMYSCHLSLS